MMNNPYKCENHKLDIICLGCVKVWIARHNKMLEFIMNIVECWECDPNHAKELLKEIGKL